MSNVAVARHQTEARTEAFESEGLASNRGTPGHLALHTDSTPSPEQFESLLRPILDTAYRAAYQFTRNPADAEDLVQEASLLAFRAFASFERGSNFRAWFLRILTNAFYTSIRRSGRRIATVSMDDSEDSRSPHETYADTDHDQISDPASIFLKQLDTEQITGAIHALPVEFRTVAQLYFVDDLPYEEISQVLGIPVGTVRSRLHRGRRILKNALLELARERGVLRVA